MFKHIKDTVSIALPFFVVGILIFFTILNSPSPEGDCPINHDCKRWTHPTATPSEKEEEWDEYKQMVGTPKTFLRANPAFDYED